MRWLAAHKQTLTDRSLDLWGWWRQSFLGIWLRDNWPVPSFGVINSATWSASTIELYTKISFTIISSFALLITTSISIARYFNERADRKRNAAIHAQL